MKTVWQRQDPLWLQDGKAVSQKHAQGQGDPGIEREVERNALSLDNFDLVNQTREAASFATGKRYREMMEKNAG